jgi:CheY-like chemotaxis protein
MLAGAKLSVLIVDDDANLRYLMEAAAARTGRFDPVASLEDGQAALTWLQQRKPQERPDMVVTDLSMPRMTGLELVRAMKGDANLRSIPVAIITSSNVPNDREHALAAGACSFVQKPHGLDALTEVFRDLQQTCCEPHEIRTSAA